MFNKRRINLSKTFSITCRCCSDIFPSSEVRIIRKKKQQVSDNLKAEKVLEETKSNKNDSKEFRVNEVNIQMISKNIYDQLFKSPSPAVDQEIIKR